MHTPGRAPRHGVLVGTVVAVGSRLNAPLYRVLRPRLIRLTPEDRSGAITFLALLPWGVPSSGRVS